jgi:hypothetical protein
LGVLQIECVFSVRNEIQICVHKQNFHVIRKIACMLIFLKTVCEYLFCLTFMKPVYLEHIIELRICEKKRQTKKILKGSDDGVYH